MGVTQLQETQARIVDLSAIDAEQLLLVWRAEQSRFDTAAFDPAGNHIRFYPRGFTVWSGFPGAGKTTLIRQTICQLLAADRNVFLASLEEHWQAILIRLAATAAGVQEPTARHLQAFLGRYGAQLMLWQEEGHAPLRRLVRRIEELNQSDGLNHAFIDSLMCLDVANDDFDAQRRAANALAITARQQSIHVHLVAHPRKLVSSEQEPDLNDVAGAREIGGLADNVLFVRRLKDQRPYAAEAQETPMGIAIRKQRHFDGRVGDIGGWFNRAQRQFHPEQGMPATRYLPEWAYGEGS